MAEVNPAEISAILKKQLKDFDSTSSLDEIGNVLTVGDGIARAYGLSNAQYGELVEFSNGTQGIVLNTTPLQAKNINEIFFKIKENEQSLIVVLDQVTDPQNIGSIMRSCALFNCKGILVSKDNAPDLTPSLIKAASVLKLPLISKGTRTHSFPGKNY